MSKVYISCPLSVPQTTLTEVSHEIEKLGQCGVRYWERETNYNEEDSIKYCDIFVLILEKNQFAMRKSVLTSGCKKELALAERYNKTIILAYKCTNGQYFFYDTIITSVGIQGLTGTANNIKSQLAARTDITESVPSRGIGKIEDVKYKLYLAYDNPISIKHSDDYIAFRDVLGISTTHADNADVILFCNKALSIDCRRSVLSTNVLTTICKAFDEGKPVYQWCWDDIDYVLYRMTGYNTKEIFTTTEHLECNDIDAVKASIQQALLEKKSKDATKQDAEIHDSIGSQIRTLGYDTPGNHLDTNYSVSVITPYNLKQVIQKCFYSDSECNSHRNIILMLM